MADIRISPADLAFMGATAKKFDAATSASGFAASVLVGLSARLQAALADAVEHIDTVADELRVFDPRRRRELQHVLETAQGGAGGAASVAGLAALVPDPRIRVAILAAGATLGAIQGARLEQIRVEVARARNEFAREVVAFNRQVREIEAASARIRAARRRTGRLG